MEYALILSLVSVLAVGSLALVGGQTSAVFASIAGTLDGQQTNGCQGGPACAGNNGNGQGNGNNGKGQGDENGNAGGGNPGGGQGNGGGTGNGGGKGSGK